MTTEATGGRPAGSDPRDDWLAESDADDLEWFPPAGEGGGRPPGRAVPRRQSAARASRGAGPVPAGPADLLRRRGIAVALLAVVVLVVVLAIIAFGGGGGGGSNPPATTGVTTTPVVTTTTGGNTRTTTTTSSSTTTKSTTTTPASTPGATVTLPNGASLQLGDTGTAVVSLQKALVALGIASLTPDGKFGPATETAVAAFQTAHGLTADGVVGAKTAAALNAALRSQG